MTKDEAQREVIIWEGLPFVNKRGVTPPVCAIKLSSRQFVL
jgi:hypothetical protein